MVEKEKVGFEIDPENRRLILIGQRSRILRS
jgi:hypothetical protein